MFQAIFTFVSTSQEVAITVDLFDNPGVRAWAYAVLLNNKNRSVMFQNISRWEEYDIIRVEEGYNNIIKTLDQLRGTVFEFKNPVPSLDNIDQEFLNTLHRHFTDSCYKLWARPLINDFCGLDSQSFFDMLSQLNPLLDDLNENVHHIETYFSTAQKIKFRNIGPELHLRCTNGTSFDIKPFNRYHSFEHADLILDAHILGKTLIESYMCNDNPNHWDTSGHSRTTGGCIFLLDDTRAQIYSSEDFTNWLTAHNLTKKQALADFPLGNCRSGDKECLINFIKDPNFNVHSCKIEIIL